MLEEVLNLRRRQIGDVRICAVENVNPVHRMLGGGIG